MLTPQSTLPASPANSGCALCTQARRPCDLQKAHARARMHKLLSPVKRSKMLVHAIDLPIFCSWSPSPCTCVSPVHVFPLCTSSHACALSGICPLKDLTRLAYAKLPFFAPGPLFTISPAKLFAVSLAKLLLLAPCPTQHLLLAPSLLSSRLSSGPGSGRTTCCLQAPTRDG